MEIFTVSFFGHRKINNPLIVEKKLDEYISDLICSKEYVEFLVGRDGEFDKMAAAAVRRAKKQYNYGNIFLTLILPYARAEFTNNEQAFLEYYDEVEICRQGHILKQPFKSETGQWLTEVIWLFSAFSTKAVEHIKP